MRLSSSAFRHGDVIPRRFTCEGEDLSPPLEWSDAPAEPRSFVLLCDDPDAPAGTWHHWAVYDIPAGWTRLQEGVGRDGEQLGFKQAINDFHRPGYGGPCPPRGHRPHRLLATSVDDLALSKDPSCQDVEREARKDVLADAVLIGLYER